MTTSAASAAMYLHPGDVCTAVRGERLQTLLGSCVAIVATDPRRTVGAMCHIVHAHAPTAPDAASTAYADAALGRMAELLLKRGIVLRLCEAWVFGGGNLYALPEGSRSVGALNAGWAQRALQALGVKVLDSDVGGNQARRLIWTVGPSEPTVERVAP